MLSADGSADKLYLFLQSLSCLHGSIASVLLLQELLLLLLTTALCCLLLLYHCQQNASIGTVIL